VNAGFVALWTTARRVGSVACLPLTPLLGGVNGPCAVTLAWAVLFVRFVSGSFAVTLARLTSVPACVARATIEIVAEAPLASVPREQVSGAVGVHDPCDGVADTRVRPAGRVSTRETPLAVPGPLFLTVIVKVAFAPTATLGVSAAFVTATSTATTAPATAPVVVPPELVVVPVVPDVPVPVVVVVEVPVVVPVVVPCVVVPVVVVVGCVVVVVGCVVVVVGCVAVVVG
jgi:hypothetical protein